MTGRTWTESEVRLLSESFANSKTADIAQALGRGYSQVAQKAASLGLRKSEAYLASENAGRIQRGKQHAAMKATQFQKGLAPWNKGVKGSTGVQERCRATQFKPGRPAHEARNYMPIGSLRLSKDGYAERKVTDDPSIVPARRWVAVHRLVWEAANGPVPPGHIVVFKPGRKTTDPALITPDALECITRVENMRRNTYHRYGEEIARLVQLRGAITRQINERAKESTT